MNSFYSSDELKEIGFASIGENVLISKKTSIYSPQEISIGNNVRIDDFCILSGKITLNNYIHIAAYVALFAGGAGIEIHDFSGISSKSTVYAVTDDYSGSALTNPTIPDKYRFVQNAKVLIKKHVLIGASCLVLPGVTLEEGSAFGAMTLIHKDSKPWSMNVGIPFKKVKDRLKDIIVLEEEFRKEVKSNE
jgi:galactoside O-acetyltransferase